MLDFATPTDKPDFKLPFTEQIDFMRQKLNIPTNRWDDIRLDQHDAGFIVAGAAKWDLLADLRAAVQIAIEQGKSIGWFRKEFDAITANRGWVGFTGDGSKAGRAWRTRVIYQTNAATSYSAGRYAQLYDPEMLKRRPYLIYRHHTFEHPRHSHKSWNELCLRADDPSWGWRMPPNGFGCNCTVDNASERDLARMGKTGPDTPPPTEYYNYKVPSTGEIIQLPKGVQYGFNYAPGKSAMETALAARMPRLEKLALSDNAVARLNINQLTNSDIFERWVQFAANGKMADSEYPIAINGDGKIVVLRAGDVANHGENINAQIWASLQAIIDNGDNVNGEYHRKISPSETRVLKLIALGGKYAPDLKIIKTAKSAKPIPANQNDGVKLADVLAAGGEWRGKIINKIGKIDDPAEFEKQFRAEIKARMKAEFGAGSVPLEPEFHNVSNVKYVEIKLSKMPVATRKKMSETMQEAVSFLPKTWIEKSNSYKNPLKLLLMKANRAFYRESKHALFLNEKTNVEVYLHEFLHSLQISHPEIDAFARDVHTKRTTLPNGKREKLKTIEGYSAKEKGRDDHYIDPYYGKEYGTSALNKIGKPLEILTMSFQHVLFGEKRYGKRDLFLHKLHEQGEPGHEIIDLVLGLLSKVK